MATVPFATWLAQEHLDEFLFGRQRGGVVGVEEQELEAEGVGAEPLRQGADAATSRASSSTIRWQGSSASLKRAWHRSG